MSTTHIATLVGVVGIVTASAASAQTVTTSPSPRMDLLNPFVETVQQLANHEVTPVSPLTGVTVPTATQTRTYDDYLREYHRYRVDYDRQYRDYLARAGSSQRETVVVRVAGNGAPASSQPAAGQPAADMEIQALASRTPSQPIR